MSPTGKAAADKPSWAGKNVTELSNDERRSWGRALSAAVRKLIPLGRKTNAGELVEIVTQTTWPETAWKCIGPVERGQWVNCPAASDGSFPAGNYVVIGIGRPANGYSGNLRWCYPVTDGRGKPHMSAIDPDFYQRD